MSPTGFPKLVAVLLATSISLEVSLLGGVVVLPAASYHLVHLLLMGALVGGQFAVSRHARRSGRPEGRVALLLAIGATSTAVGDFVNSGLSSVEPVSHKLTWALLLFGVGYGLYVAALVRPVSEALRVRSPALYPWRHTVALPILAANVAGWWVFVRPYLEAHDLLRVGSLVFSASLYVMLPTVALWNLVARRADLGAIAVGIGAILIPFSDLVLFGTWLRDGDPSVPTQDLYALNWILYFGGQSLFALYAAVELGDPSGDAGRP